MTRQVRNAKTPGAAVVYELSKAQTEFWTATERVGGVSELSAGPAADCRWFVGACRWVRVRRHFFRFAERSSCVCACVGMSEEIAKGRGFPRGDPHRQHRHPTRWPGGAL